MNSCGLPEMLLSLNGGDSSENNTEMSVLERQRSRLKWQQGQIMGQEQNVSFFNNGQLGGVFSNDQGIGEILTGGAMKPDPGVENGWGDDYRRVFNYGKGSEYEVGYAAFPGTASCPPNVAAANKGKEAAISSAAAAGKDSSKKRKAEKAQHLKTIPEEKSEEKKLKGGGEEDSKITEQNSNNSKSSTITASTNTNNKNTKGPSEKDKAASEVPKPDYIHVRARRGQATDSHSLAERVRREKISERMRYLQDLVPGCNKITGKAGMLDEIINYVQSLQRQVEFLSMKLATINPRLEFDIDNYLVKELFPAIVPAIGTSSDMVNRGHLQFNGLGQGVLGSSVEMVGNNPMDVALRRTISAPVSIPQNFPDSSNLNQMQTLTWEDELQNLYNMELQQGRSTSFTSQAYTGFTEQGHVKMEM